MAEDTRPIAVIGAGFSGTILARHLLDRTGDRQVLLCERGPTFARGTAYATHDPVHLLNVRAENMSAFSREPDHFAAWLRDLPAAAPGHVHETQVGTFVSRALYAHYLSHLVQEVLAGEDGARRFRIVPEEVVRLVPEPHGGFVLHLEGGRTREIAGAILAIGHLDPERADAPGRVIHDPWSTDPTAGLEPGRPVVIVGTGLTMVDIVMSLSMSGFPGAVLAISRRGLLPRTHVSAEPWRLQHFDPLADHPLGSAVQALRREVEAAGAAGVPWQSVIDALRPSTAAAWRGWSVERQSRFLRHLRPWWDVHRHRMAPPVGERIRRLLESGYLTACAGQIAGIREEDDAAVVDWTARGGARQRTLAQRVVFATGAAPARQVSHRLLNSLLQTGLARLDRHGLGIEVDGDFRVVGRGEWQAPLWAVGPIVRGAFWECSAVPDIRRDAERLAETVGAELRRAAIAAR